jgi:uncharacterized protein (DUF58 family)
MDFGRASLTPRGWALLVVALLLALGALLFGVGELYPVAAAALVLIVAARVWVGTRRWDVRVVRHVRPARVPAGVAARVELAVANHSRSSSPILSAADPFDGGRRWARFLIAPLEPGEVRWAAYTLPTSQRGVFELGPLRLELSDPFGLSQQVTIGCPGSLLTVHPTVDAIRPNPSPAVADPDRRVPLPVVGRIGDEFYGLREYRVGDDLRRVHWASTARNDQLMIRQPQNLLQGRLTVAVDLRSTIHDAASLEAALSAAASIVMAAIHGRTLVRVSTTAGVDTGFGSTAAHGAALLDILAAAMLHPGSSLVDDLRVRSGNGPLTLVTTGSVPDAELAAVTRAGRGDLTTFVVFERSTPGLSRLAMDRYRHPTRGRVVSVAAGASFPSAWEGVGC